MRVMRRPAALAGAAAMLTAVPGNAHAAPAKVFETASIGTHNAYDKSEYTYFAQALDSGSSLLEIDIYADSVDKGWRVSHSDPIGNDNDCEDAKTPSELYSKDRNQDFGSCLDNIAAWNQLHPDHAPIVFTMEMKAGFNNDVGLGPDEFDTLVDQKLGSGVYKPSDLLGSSYSTLDAAAKANAWPSRDSLKGKFVFEVVPGTVERKNPPDHYWTDQEYGDHLRDLYTAGNIARAGAFPAVPGAANGDPRASRWTSDTSIRPWLVFFDGDAATYVNNGHDTSFYSTNHCILITTDAYNVSPAISSTAPADAEVAARPALLAGDRASIITSGWSAKSASVLSSVVARS